jgi:hypothetical protein
VFLPSLNKVVHSFIQLKSIQIYCFETWDAWFASRVQKSNGVLCSHEAVKRPVFISLRSETVLKLLRQKWLLISPTISLRRMSLNQQFRSAPTVKVTRHTGHDSTTRVDFLVFEG